MCRSPFFLKYPNGHCRICFRSRFVLSNRICLYTPRFFFERINMLFLKVYTDSHCITILYVINYLCCKPLKFSFHSTLRLEQPYLWLHRAENVTVFLLIPNFLVVCWEYNTIITKKYDNFLPTAIHHTVDLFGLIYLLSLNLLTGNWFFVMVQ